MIIIGQRKATNQDLMGWVASWTHMLKDRIPPLEQAHELNKGVDLFANLITLLHDSRHRFYLTGSRFFNTHTCRSDWDFFTDQSAEDFLVNDLGLLYEGESYYPTSNSLQDTISVFSDPIAKIHIQIVKNVNLKNRIQNLMLKYRVKSPSEKQASRNRWEFYYSLVLSKERHPVCCLCKHNNPFK